jgi:hypothetical protein
MGNGNEARIGYGEWLRQNIKKDEHRNPKTKRVS